MAKVTAPMLSLDARGRLGDSLIFSKQRGTNYTKAYAVPNNPQTAPQVGHRMGIAAITQHWAGLYDSQKASWADLASVWNLSNYHAYLKHNTLRWNDLLPPQSQTPEDGYPPTNPQILTAHWTGTLYELEHAVTYGGRKPYFCQLHASQTPDFEPTKSNLIHLATGYVRPVTTWYHTYDWTPPTAGTWYFKARFNHQYGDTSPWVANS